MYIKGKNVSLLASKSWETRRGEGTKYKDTHKRIKTRKGEVKSVQKLQQGISGVDGGKYTCMHLLGMYVHLLPFGIVDIVVC